MLYFPNTWAYGLGILFALCVFWKVYSLGRKDNLGIISRWEVSQPRKDEEEDKSSVYLS